MGHSVCFLRARWRYQDTPNRAYMRLQQIEGDFQPETQRAKVAARYFIFGFQPSAAT